MIRDQGWIVYREFVVCGARCLVPCAEEPKTENGFAKFLGKCVIGNEGFFFFSWASKKCARIDFASACLFLRGWR